MTDMIWEGIFKEVLLCTTTLPLKALILQMIIAYENESFQFKMKVC